MNHCKEIMIYKYFLIFKIKARPFSALDRISSFNMLKGFRVGLSVNLPNFIVIS